METTAIDLKLDPYLIKTSSSSSSKSFLVANGDGKALRYVSDIEMVAIQASNYTSLKDLIPAAARTASFVMATSSVESWREIAIKDPLVKQAAMSYLQPMFASPMEVDSRSFVVKLKDDCFGCFGRVNDAVVRCLSAEDGDDAAI